jgi:hypothetical protein
MTRKTTVGSQDNSLANKPAAGRRPRELFQRLQRITKKISVGVAVSAALTFAGWLLGSYFQYISWRDQQNIDLFKQDFTAANTAFAEVSGVLSTAMNLQQMIEAHFRSAVIARVDADDSAFLTVSGRRLYQPYVDAQNSLKENIDVLARKMEIFVDWASDLTHNPSAKGQGADRISRSTLDKYDFKCEKDVPDVTDFEKLTTQKIEKKDESKIEKTYEPLQIDWHSAKHHVLTFQYCLEEIHKKILPALQWASHNAVDPYQKDSFVADEDLDVLVGKQVERLNAFMLLVMWRLDDIRQRYQRMGYGCHVLGLCSSAHPAPLGTPAAQGEDGKGQARGTPR